MSYTIRRFQPDDKFYSTKSVKTIWNNFPEFLNIFNSKKKYEKSILCEPLLDNYAFAYDYELNDKNTLCLVLLFNEKVIAMSVFMIDIYDNKQDTIYLASFCIDPNFRGKDKGISDMFLKESLKRASVYFKNKLFTMLASEQGTKLYKRFGFREIPSSFINKFFNKITGFTPMVLHLDSLELKDDANVKSIVRSVERRHLHETRIRSRQMSRSRQRSKSRK